MVTAHSRIAAATRQPGGGSSPLPTAASSCPYANHRPALAQGDVRASTTGRRGLALAVRLARAGSRSIDAAARPFLEWGAQDDPCAAARRAREGSMSRLTRTHHEGIPVGDSESWSPSYRQSFGR